MASVELSADVPISPQDTWDHVSELSELGEWLVIHEGWRSVNANFAVVEVPITFTEREIGVSKMSGSNIREALVKVAQWGWKGRVERRRNRSRSSGART
ncbi:hypothetical protein A9W94_11675 [Mycobacterium asiaticum]|nr:hypothetical protein A9W94_11675 [Mycobacterium asiaticum]